MPGPAYAFALFKRVKEHIRGDASRPVPLENATPTPVTPHAAPPMAPAMATAVAFLEIPYDEVAAPRPLARAMLARPNPIFPVWQPRHPPFLSPATLKGRAASRAILNPPALLLVSMLGTTHFCVLRVTFIILLSTIVTR